MFQRLDQLFQSDSVSRFRILFGPGIEDQFWPVFLETEEHKLQKSHRQADLVDFETALRMTLQQNGYRRVIFVAPHKPFYFNDLESKQMTMNPFTLEDGEHKNKKRTIPGPLGSVSLLPGKKAHPNFQRIDAQNPDLDLVPFHGMGDTYAVRLLDHFMRSKDCGQTAIVVMQADSFLQYRDDPRSVVSLMGEWARVQETEGNLCIFVFSAKNFENLSQQVNQIPLPEIRAMIMNPDQQADLFQVGYPHRDETFVLINRSTHGEKTMSAEDKEWLCRAILAEGGSLSLWLKRLNWANRNAGWDRSRYPDWFHHINPRGIKAMEQLEKMIGLPEVKKHIRETTALMGFQLANKKAEPINLHMMFTGNPGTGKTSVARLMGEIFFDIGYLSRGHLVEASVADLVADHMGGTSIKTNTLVNQALGGVLFIDEAYMLTDEERGKFGQEALDTLLIRMENERHRLVVIFAGYPDKMRKFRESNPGLPRRIPADNVVEFQDFNEDALFLIINDLLQEKGFRLDTDLKHRIQLILHVMVEQKDEQFGNAGEMRNLSEAMIKRWAVNHQDNYSDQVLTLNDLPDQYRRYAEQKELQVSEVDDNLSDLIGMDHVKGMFDRLSQQIRFEQLRATINQQTEANTIRPQHMVFFGNPGTGKTTFARKVGKMYYQAGMLRKGHCIEVGRSGLVGAYVGQTALKVMDVIAKAMDGVLFIDEAYALLNGGSSDFGQEAIDTLVKAMEDYKNRLVIIFAGYEQEMTEFLGSNPGLASRIPLQVHFPDFRLEELGEILAALCQKEGLILPESVKAAACELLAARQLSLGTHFGNARSAQNLFQQMKTQMSMRVLQKDLLEIEKNPQLVNQFELFDLEGLS